MLSPRLIPFLLIRGKGLVKTIRFSDDKYVGDPLNAVRIFNEKKVDEIVVLDIDASSKGEKPNYELIEKLAAECRMPLCYGGGIKNTDDACRILSLGVEKVSISSEAINNPRIIKELSNKVGSQSVVVTLDIKKKLFGGYEAYIHNGRVRTKRNPMDLVKIFEDKGAGEIVINSIDNDGVMEGYDLNLIRDIKNNTTIPITVVGGCGSLEDVKSLYLQEGIIGSGAGSLFVFKGKYRAVLITYPKESEKIALFDNIDMEQIMKGLA